MGVNWWVFIPDQDQQRAQLIYNEAITQKCIGLTFGDYMGDLKNYGTDRQSFKKGFARIRGYSPNDGTSVSFGGMFFNIGQQIQIGDLVVYPSTTANNQINIGRVTSEYRFCPDQHIMHRRDVVWLAHYPRSSFDSNTLKYSKSLAVSPIKPENVFLSVLIPRLRHDKVLDE